MVPMVDITSNMVPKEKYIQQTGSLSVHPVDNSLLMFIVTYVQTNTARFAPTVVPMSIKYDRGVEIMSCLLQ